MEEQKPTHMKQVYCSLVGEAGSQDLSLEGLVSSKKVKKDRVWITHLKCESVWGHL